MATTPDHVTMAVQVRGPVRTEVLMGREFRVVSAVLVKSKVLNNNLGRTFLPAEEVTQRWADSANGAPVIIDHPSMRGRPVSARDPDILNASGVGFLFRARAQNGQIGADVFFDASRVNDVPALSTILNRLDAGQRTEGSTGFPLRSLENTPGAFNGEPFDVVMRPGGFDHFAVFADEQKGACSVLDGCGLGVNHAGPCDGETAVEETTEAENVGRFEQAMRVVMAFLSGAKAPEPETPG